jgi:glutathionyl-hydroquinone reductase
MEIEVKRFDKVFLRLIKNLDEIKEFPFFFYWMRDAVWLEKENPLWRNYTLRYKKNTRTS